MKVKYSILMTCFIYILYCSSADSALTVDSVVDDIVPDCFFGVENISFILYTRNIKDGIVLTVENITNTDVFKRNVLYRPVVFLIHGFISSANNSHYTQLSEAILEKDDVLVISIDWKEGACTGGLVIAELAGYIKAAKNTKVVGEYVANFTKILIEEYNVKLNDITVIGHSLGAQVAGFAGKEIQKLQLGKYPIIIGLEPANPFFGYKNCSNRLCVTDADFVEIVHTTLGIGIVKPIGNVDFYINKGIQPGCGVDPSCAHSRAVQYLTESIKHECCLIGTSWDYILLQSTSGCTKDSCACLGLNARNYLARGTLYVETTLRPPYCNNNGKVL